MDGCGKPPLTKVFYAPFIRRWRIQIVKNRAVAFDTPMYMNRFFMGFSLMLTLGLSYVCGTAMHAHRMEALLSSVVRQDAVADTVLPASTPQGTSLAQSPVVENHLVTQSMAPVAPNLKTCLYLASQTYHVPPDVIRGVMSVEGGRVGMAVGPNINGTYDLGPMQINTLWVPRLARLWGVGYNTAYHAIRDSGCENIYIGTWILKQKMMETGGLYNGIAAYHSASRAYGPPYANKVVYAMEHVPPVPPLMSYNEQVAFASHHKKTHHAAGNAAHKMRMAKM